MYNETLEKSLLSNIKTNINKLKELQKQASKDRLEYYYRFYHQSFKVYYLQETTKEIHQALANLLPNKNLNVWFSEIIEAGTEKIFELSHNNDWLKYTLPIIQAFDQASYFLDIAISCYKYDEVKNLLPIDLAGLLYLFDLR